MRTAVRRNRGIVSKEGGDGLIALFGAPHADDNHAVMACHAAIELVRRISCWKIRTFTSGSAFTPAMSSRISSKLTSLRSMKQAGRRSTW